MIVLNEMEAELAFADAPSKKAEKKSIYEYKIFPNIN